MLMKAVYLSIYLYNYIYMFLLDLDVERLVNHRSVVFPIFGFACIWAIGHVLKRK